MMWYYILSEWFNLFRLDFSLSVDIFLHHHNTSSLWSLAKQVPLEAFFRCPNKW